MLLIRHNVSRPPYEDYNTMSLGMLDDIATFEIEPHVQIFAREDVPDELAEALGQGNPVRCSPSLRTRETHDIARSVLDLSPIVPIVDDRLKEIWFKPSRFVKENESPLDAIRERLYDGMIEGSPAMESFKDVLVRVDSLLDDPELKDAACFTHGFLMRFIKAYVAVDRNVKLLSQALKNTQPIEYLGCFKVNQKEL